MVYVFIYRRGVEISDSLFKAKKILILGAHPDDI